MKISKADIFGTLVLMIAGRPAVSTDVKQGVLVFEANGPVVKWVSKTPKDCVTEVTVGPGVKLTIPYSNGVLDEKHASLDGVKATYRPDCPTATLKFVKVDNEQ